MQAGTEGRGWRKISGRASMIHGRTAMVFAGMSVTVARAAWGHHDTLPILIRVVLVSMFHFSAGQAGRGFVISARGCSGCSYKSVNSTARDRDKVRVRVPSRSKNNHVEKSVSAWKKGERVIISTVCAAESALWDSGWLGPFILRNCLEMARTLSSSALSCKLY